MPAETYAAIDLGSNSFRLEIAQFADNQLHELISLREPVRLAAGLTATGALDAPSQERALAALSRFREALRHVARRNVQAVATNTWRVATNAQQFRPRAEEALGTPIRIITGEEEARLIYFGVSLDPLPDPQQQRLIVDIGGGSTELIVGRKRKIRLLESLPMGCVVFSRRYFPDGQLTEQNFRRAQQAAIDTLAPYRDSYLKEGWKVAVGSSGTVNSISKIGYATHHDQPFDISRSSLVWLRDQFLAAGRTDNLHLPTLSVDRSAVLAGGLAILMAIFESLHLEHMGSSKKALRHGLLYIMANGTKD